MSEQTYERTGGRHEPGQHAGIPGRHRPHGAEWRGSDGMIELFDGDGETRGFVLAAPDGTGFTWYSWGPDGASGFAETEEDAVAHLEASTGVHVRTQPGPYHGPSPEQPQAPAQAGVRDGVIVCPHCLVKGQVHTGVETVKRGISGAKATAAVLTGGVSLLGTGLARKEKVTRADCGNCGQTWTY